MTKQTNETIVERWQQKQDPEDLSWLIDNNRGLVRSAVRRFNPPFDIREDLEQIGVIGLINAANNLDPRKGQYSTFATTIMMRLMRPKVLSLTSPIEFSQRLSDETSLLSRAESALLKKQVDPDTIQGASLLSEMLDLAPERVAAIKRARDLTTIYLEEEPVQTPSPSFESRRDMMLDIKAALSTLTPRERQTLEAAYNGEGGFNINKATKKLKQGPETIKKELVNITDKLKKSPFLDGYR